MTKGIYDIEFFPAMDRQEKKPDGKITSEYPAWYLKNQIDFEKEDIESEKRTLKRSGDEDMVGPLKRVTILKRLKEREQKLRDIINSKPVLTGAQKDELSKEYSRLGEQIKNSLFDRTAMMRGRCEGVPAIAKEESRRMTEPIISTDGRDELFKNLNIKIEKGMISRNAAIKAWKIMGALLDEDTWIEDLRPDHNYGTFKLIQSLQELIEESG